MPKTSPAITAHIMELELAAHRIRVHASIARKSCKQRALTSLFTFFLLLFIPEVDSSLCSDADLLPLWNRGLFQLSSSRFYKIHPRQKYKMISWV